MCAIKFVLYLRVKNAAVSGFEEIYLCPIQDTCVGFSFFKKLRIEMSWTAKSHKTFISFCIKPKLILVDGNKTPEIKNYNLKSVVKGDKKIPSISAASIIAKVSRDRLVKNLSKKFNKYYWETNCGYGTKKHLVAIKKHGITIHHRKTFAPISKLK